MGLSYTSLVLALRLIRPFTLMFSRFLGSKTYDPNFSVFCMPVPDDDLEYVHYLFCPRTVGNLAAV